jgi:hypothetical protein
MDIDAHFDVDIAGSTLGPGPMRFYGKKEALFAQLVALGLSQLTCYNNLKRRWEKKNRLLLSDDHFLRYARNSGSKGFDEKAAWNLMKRLKVRYLTMSCWKLEEQLSR